jgi:hypothetical protein
VVFGKQSKALVEANRAQFQIKTGPHSGTLMVFSHAKAKARTLDRGLGAGICRAQQGLHGTIFARSCPLEYKRSRTAQFLGTPD